MREFRKLFVLPSVASSLFSVRSRNGTRQTARWIVRSLDSRDRCYGVHNTVVCCDSSTSRE